MESLANGGVRSAIRSRDWPTVEYPTGPNSGYNRSVVGNTNSFGSGRIKQTMTSCSVSYWYDAIFIRKYKTPSSMKVQSSRRFVSWEEQHLPLSFLCAGPHDNKTPENPHDEGCYTVCLIVAAAISTVTSQENKRTTAAVTVPTRNGLPAGVVANILSNKYSGGTFKYQAAPTYY